MDDVTQWRLVAVHPIGGLTEVGFVPRSSRLLVASHQGRGEYDLVDGARLARDRSEDSASWFDPNGPVCLALVSPAWVPVAGLAGGTLPIGHGRWQLELSEERAVVVDAASSISQQLCVGEEVRVAGFAPGGQTIVVGRPMDLSIYRAP